MTRKDRALVADLIVSIENFNPAEVDCALELVDIYLNDPKQLDYNVVVAEESIAGVHAYACWGPVPLTKGTYDLYWIAYELCGTQGAGTQRPSFGCRNFVERVVCTHDCILSPSWL
jgi:hypothetical protein